MTAQFNDIFRLHDNEYVVAGISEGELFIPSLFSLNPVMAGTACWRGFIAVYSLLNERLILDDLYINLAGTGNPSQSKQGPLINGIVPTSSHEHYGLFNNFYRGLNYSIEYSGGVLIARDFIKDLYVHMGFHPAWKYKTVIELVFTKGNLIEETDKSIKMAEIRTHMPADSEIKGFIQSAFDRTYDKNI